MLGIYDEREQALAVGDLNDILPFTNLKKRSLSSVICRIKKGEHSGILRNGCMIAIIKD